MFTLVSSQTSTDSKPLNFDSISPFSLSRMVYGSPKDIYQEITVLKSISKTKPTVYLVSSQISKLNYAMKVFVHRNESPPLPFKNGIRFTSLRHLNIIRNLYSQQQREAMIDGVSTNIAYTITEYASRGDFLNLLKKKSEEIDEKIIRTYFKQLIDGLEYLHKNGVSHGDLKLTNLLLSEDFILKISDFDMAHYVDDSLILSYGTKCYRAPELAMGRCNNPKAADIYSAGIILFSLVTRGTLPQFEDELIEGINFADLLANDTYRFWLLHSKLQKTRRICFDQDFKDLFEAMTKLNPSERPSIDVIKASRWYNKPSFYPEELTKVMRRLFDS